MIKQEVCNSLKEMAKHPEHPGISFLRSVSLQTIALRMKDFYSDFELSSDSLSLDEDNPGKPVFSLEDTEQLLKAVRSIMKVEEHNMVKSVQDIVFEGLETRHRRVVPIHKNIWSLICKEWINGQVFLNQLKENTDSARVYGYL